MDDDKERVEEALGEMTETELLAVAVDKRLPVSELLYDLLIKELDSGRLEVHDVLPDACKCHDCVMDRQMEDHK